MLRAFDFTKFDLVLDRTRETHGTFASREQRMLVLFIAYALLVALLLARGRFSLARAAWAMLMSLQARASCPFAT